MMSNVLQDADHLQMTYQMLLTNQTQASVWIGRVLDSVMEMITKVSLSSWLITNLIVLSLFHASFRLIHTFSWLLGHQCYHYECCCSGQLEGQLPITCNTKTSLRDVFSDCTHC